MTDSGRQIGDPPERQFVDTGEPEVKGTHWKDFAELEAALEQGQCLGTATEHHSGETYWAWVSAKRTDTGYLRYTHRGWCCAFARLADTLVSMKNNPNAWVAGTEIDGEFVPNKPDNGGE